MTHTPALYIELGYRYERTSSKALAAQIADTLRRMLARETDPAEARRLIEQGRKEARQ